MAETGAEKEPNGDSAVYVLAGRGADTLLPGRVSRTTPCVPFAVRLVPRPRTAADVCHVQFAGEFRGRRVRRLVVGRPPDVTSRLQVRRRTPTERLVATRMRPS